MGVVSFDTANRLSLNLIKSEKINLHKCNTYISTKNLHKISKSENIYVDKIILFDYSTSEFQVTKATKCPTENDNKCQSFWHQLFMYPGQNLREGLKCLRYDGNITSNQAFGKTSIPQKIYVDMPSVDIIELNEKEEFGVWRFRTQFTWYDERLKWPIECQKGVEGDTDFVKSALLDLLWNPTSVLQDITGTFDPKYQNTIYINQASTILLQ